MHHSLNTKVPTDIKRYILLHIAVFIPLFFILETKVSADIIVFPKAQIHRGYWQGGAQENTLEAFRAAKTAKHSMIELDVQLSKDKKVVVFHDFDLKRIGGSSDKVSALTADELKTRVHAPTLNEVLSDSEIPGLVNIEIKQQGPDDLGIERALKEVIEQNQATNRVIISSFNEFSLGRCAQLMPNITRAYLLEKTENENNVEFIKRIKSKFETTKTKLLHLHYSSVKDHLENLLKAEGYSFSVWTVDDSQIAIDMLKAGSLSIITNRVDMKL
jgi:glycerophosphoryl diester phosphodiesterase